MNIKKTVVREKGVEFVWGGTWEELNKKKPQS